MNNKFLEALRGRNSGRPPIWIMRQAGRYMPEYRALRERYSFLEMCHNPELAAQVTMLPIKAFGMDAAILFSDILVIPEALGVGLHFDEGMGPVIDRKITCQADIVALPALQVEHSLGFVGQAIGLVKPQLKVPLIGFCGAPFTVASYMIEGKSSKDLKKTKQWMFSNPEGFHALLNVLADCTIAYLNMQVAAGVDALQIFDSWAHVLGHRQFREFSLPYLERIVQGIKDPSIPIILFCRGSSVFAPQLAELHPRVAHLGISLDWNSHMPEIRKRVPHPVALQGNLDPDVLYAPPAHIRKEVHSLLDSMRGDPAFIFNLGHGIHPDISVEAVKTLVDCVKAS